MSAGLVRPLPRLIASAISMLRRRRLLLGVLAAALLVLAYATGTLLQRRARQDELTLWSQAVARAPRSAPAHFHRALALEALGRFPEAEASAAEAITWDPAMGPAYALYGRLVLRRGEVEQAIHALSRAQRYAPSDPSTLRLDQELAARTSPAGPVSPSSPPAR
jgi:tetratricopeptide (TPR) repeat protein